MQNMQSLPEATGFHIFAHTGPRTGRTTRLNRRRRFCDSGRAGRDPGPDPVSTGLPKGLGRRAGPRSRPPSSNRRKRP